MINYSKEISTLFFAIDGDDIGPKLRSFIIGNDTVGAANFSKSLDNYFQSLSKWLESKHFTIIFCGGDSILAQYSKEDGLGYVDSLPSGLCSISVGIGATAEFAYLALQLAKARGKSQAVIIENTKARTLKSWD